MTVVRVKGLKRYFEPKSGKWYAYHRKTGKRLKSEFGTPEFFVELASLNDASAEKTAKPGTIGALMTSYRSSSGFLSLAGRTRSDYNKVMNYLAQYDETPLSDWTMGVLTEVRDDAFNEKKRKFANYVLTVLSILFEHGIEREMVTVNPVTKVKRVRKAKDSNEANRPWTDVEREAVEETLPAHMRLPVALMMYGGLDPQDALRLPRTAVSDGMIDTRRGKTGVPVWMPMPSPVAEVMSASPKHDAITLCANSYGKPWTYNGFSTNWHRIKSKMEAAGKIQPGLTLKGLRHTVATILREMGKDPATIANMLGQKTEAMAKHYSRRADMSKNMTETVDAFSAEVNRRRTKVSRTEK